MGDIDVALFENLPCQAMAQELINMYNESIKRK